MSVKAAAASNASAGDFYFNYMSLIMHPEEGSDLAKRDGSLVKVSSNELPKLRSLPETNPFIKIHSGMVFHVVFFCGKP